MPRISPRGIAVILAGLVLMLAIGFRVAPDWWRRADGDTDKSAAAMPAETSAGTGHVVVFDSDSPYLVPGDTNGSSDVFVRDLSTGITERVSVNSEEKQANTKDPYGSSFGSISADGRFVAFASDASNLVPGDTNEAGDVFVRDRVEGTTERVSVSSDGSEATGESFDISMSADGRYVAFSSFASNLVSEDTNGGDDVFVHDRATGTTERVSVADGGEQSDVTSRYGSYGPSLSADGRYVAFFSDATNLVPGDTNGNRDVFVRDRETGTTERVSVAADGEQGNHGSETAQVSADGRYVVFASYASNLVPGDTNDEWDLFLHDRTSGTIERISVASDGTQGNASSGYGNAGLVGADGRYVIFDSDASSLDAEDTNDSSDVFVRDRVAGTTKRISLSSAGKQGNGDSYLGPMSTDGRLVAFRSAASNLIPGDRNHADDVFIRDLVGETTTRVSFPLPRVTAGELVLRPGPPEAGQPLVASMPVLVGDTSAANARISCAATVAGSALRVTASSYRTGTGRCAWHVPETSAGIVITGNVRATSGAAAAARTFRARIEASGPRVEITSFRHRGLSPGGITAGPDGALWFTNGGSIGRITTSGAVTMYESKAIRSAYGITAGPDGALWFTDYDGNAVGRMTTRGHVRMFRDKRVRYPVAIAAGPDGALWFTMYSEGAMYDGDPNASGIGRITTDGEITVYRRNIDAPGGITTGPDGALWFNSYNYKEGYTTIGRITIHGATNTVTSRYSGTEGGSPSLGITTGPDRALWFTDPTDNTIGRIGRDRRVTIFQRDKGVDSPDAMTVGPDGALWFTNGDSIGRIATTGTVSVYHDKSIRSPQAITLGPDSALWFTNGDGKSIGRLWILPTG